MALLVCVLVFALAHLPQGVRATCGIALLGICFHILYFVSRGLLAPVVAHATYDIAIFTIFYRREIQSARSIELPQLWNKQHLDEMSSRARRFLVAPSLLRHRREQRRVHQPLELLVVGLEVHLQVRAVGVDRDVIQRQLFDRSG